MPTEFKLPEVGEGIESGTVVGILVAVGDTVEKDQPVLELETDKAVVEVPSSVAGVVQAINVKENEEAKVGQVILTVGDAAGDEGADAASGETTEETDGEAEASAGEGEVEEVAEDLSAETSEEADEARNRAADAEVRAEEELEEEEEEVEEETDEAANAETAEKAQEAPGSYEGNTGKLIPAAPSVRRLAREKGVDLSGIQGSGPLGRISAEDVMRYAEGGTPSEAPAPASQKPAQTPAPQAPAVSLPDFSKWGETTREPMSGIRKATVRSMTQAWATVPMVTQFDKADIIEFERLRKKYAPRAETVGAKLTPTAMIIKVVAGALRQFPDFNASIDTQSSEIVYKKYVNVGVAVDTERGLLVPVIKNADQKGIIELSKELGDLAEKARARKLGPEDMQGGNFSVSNLGGIGGTGFTPIVNPPDVAILGVSRGAYEPVYNRDTAQFEPRMMMPLSVTYDHRLIDGAAAARFLRWICAAIEDPFLMALG